MHPTGLVDFAVFFSVSKALHLAARRGQAEVKKCSGFFWMFLPSTAICIHYSLQAVQLLIGGGSIINQHKYIGLDSVPSKTAWFMDVYLRVSAAWKLLCGAKVKSAFIWVQVHPWDWQTRTPICAKLNVEHRHMT